MIIVQVSGLGLLCKTLKYLVYLIQDRTGSLYRFNSIKADKLLYDYKRVGILNYRNISRFWKWEAQRLVSRRWNCSPGILVSPLLQCLTQPLLVSLPMLSLPLHKDSGCIGLKRANTTSFTLNYCLKGLVLKYS